MGKTVGKLIKAARTDADLTQEQLAKKISGLSANDVSLAERGQKDLTQAQLKAIAKATGVTQASLVNAAKEEAASSIKKTATAAKKTASTAKKTSAAPKTPSNANTSMKVTSTEKKLIEAYRQATSDAKKRAMSVLKGEEPDVAGTVEDVIEGVLENLLGKK